MGRLDLKESHCSIIHTCRGLYVKLAQALATQGPFLPAPYMKLAKLLDDAERFEYDIVKDVSLYLPNDIHKLTDFAIYNRSSVKNSALQ